MSSSETQKLLSVRLEVDNPLNSSVDSKANFIKLDFGNLLGKTNPGQKDKKVEK